MLNLILSLIVFSPFCLGSVGEVLALKGGTNASLYRSGTRTALDVGSELEIGDTLRSDDSHVVFMIYPKIQMSLSRGSEMKITSHLVDSANTEKSSSLIELIKGIIRVQVIRDEGEQVEHKIDAGGVSFAVRGTEFEVTSTEDDAELDVIEGEVEVSSPYVQTFVPEIVKGNEGFRYSKRAKKFERRARRKQLRESYLLDKQTIRERARKRKADKKAVRLERKERRESAREERRERKAGARKSPR